MKRLAKYIPKDMPSGKILGKVILVDCIKCDDDFKGKCLKENKDIVNRKQQDCLWVKENYWYLSPLLYVPPLFRHSRGR